MIQTLSGTKKEKDKLQKLVDAVLDARKRGIKAELEMYAACLELEESKAWMITGWSYQRLVKELGVNFWAYDHYRLGVQLFGTEGLKAIGLAACREILRLVGSDPARSHKLYAKAMERIVAFRLDRGFDPSGTYQNNIVREEAEKLGYPVPPRNSKGKQAKLNLAKTVQSLRQICELYAHEPTSPAYLIASRTLDQIGISVDADEEKSEARPN
jgi:hypothetical protein